MEIEVYQFAQKFLKIKKIVLIFSGKSKPLLKKQIDGPRENCTNLYRIIVSQLKISDHHSMPVT